MVLNHDPNESQTSLGATCAKVSDWRGLCLRTSAKWADFVAQSLHWKLPFPTQVRDWFDDWVVGSQFDI